MNILIPIETASRELLYKTYLCHHLALKGFKCFLGNKQDIHFLMDKMNNYAYLDKGYHKDVSEKIYEKIKINNGVIINLDEEGGIDYHDNSTLLERYSKELFDKSDLIFLWGKYQHSMLEQRINKISDVIITGHPRFELLKEKYRFFYSDELVTIKNKYKNFILINSNFGFGNNIKGDDFVVNNYKNRFSKIQKKIDFDKRKRELFIELSKAISTNLGNPIIFRPHPEEDKSYYENAFVDFSNIHVIYQGSVVPWLLASEVMIHSDCTTSIESLMLGKKSISFLPKNYDENAVTHLPLKASYIFTDLQKLLNFLDTELHKQLDFNYSDYPFIEDYFSFSQNSTELITDQIFNEMNLKNNGTFSKLSIRDIVWLKMRSLKSKFLLLNRNRLFRNKLNGLNNRNIKHISSQIIKEDNKFESVRLSKISNELYCFHK